MMSGTATSSNSEVAPTVGTVQHVNSSGAQNVSTLPPSMDVGVPIVAQSHSSSTILPLPSSSLVQPSPNVTDVQSQMANIQALAQTLQSNSAGGNIFVLNVGNANNLAATLSQLVSSNPLNSNAYALLGAASQKPSLSTTTTQSVAPQVPVIASSSTLPSIATNMNIQSNLQTAILSQQINQSMLQVPAQLPQQPQQAAGFMIVPIPPPPQAQQPPVIFNVQSQLQGNVQVQPQALPYYVQQHQQSFIPHTSLVNSNVGKAPTIQQSPRSEELRSYLSRNQNWPNPLQICSTNSVDSQSFITAAPAVSSSNFVTVLNAAQTQSRPHEQVNYSTLTQVPSTKPTEHMHEKPPHVIPTVQHPPVSQISAGQHTVRQSPPTPEQEKVKLSLQSQHEPKVSSPGLAFLAQVSSLTSGNRPVPTHLYGSTGVIEDYISHQAHACLPILPLDDVKVGAPASEETSIASGSMTVSSTTKIGDDGLVVLPVMPENNGAIGQLVTVHTESTDPVETQNIGTALKRKKEMPRSPLIVKEKKKKGPAPKLNGNELCLICNDKASGFHYNTLSCEGCKGFFRRTVIKGASYHCKQNGDCTMDLYMRRKCQKCRFDKCKSVGMKEESVLSEEKIKAKKQKKECENLSSSTRLLDDPSIPKLTPQQRSLLELLQANERRFQWPTAEDVKKVTVWVEDDNVPHCRALRFAHFTEMCILIVQLVVEFTKQLPGFLRVLREDQIVLLKACAIEVMLLRAAKAYNKHDGTINFLNEKFYDKSTFYKAGIQVEFVDPIFTFCKSMARLDLDETEYAILVAINTFSSDRPHIKDVEKVESMQDPYVELLRLYTKIRHPDDPLMFARILMKIVELRSLNNYHSEQMFALKVQDQKLPPLLAEIWDM